jgi:hypothetical protein
MSPLAPRSAPRTASFATKNPFTFDHTMLPRPLSWPPTPAPPLYPRQDAITTATDEAVASSSASVFSAQLEIWGSHGHEEVTALATTAVPSEQLYFECPDGAEDTWKQATMSNGDLGQETTGQGCLVSFTGTFAQGERFHRSKSMQI